MIEPNLTLPDAIRTERLILRRWRDDDLEPFAELNSDSEVMAYMPALLDRPDSDALATRIREQFEQRGFGLWAVEVPGGAPFIGYVGLAIPRFSAHFTPCVEIGWRLARAHWGRGYATEAASASLTFGFESVRLQEIVSFTVPANVRSIAVMQRIGMTHDPADAFDHPSLPVGHPLRRHVLYRLACTSRS
jgi:RimJ/RimL family protein N-acetyltransferase